MGKKRRVDLRGILAKPDLRRDLMVPTIQATQAREGIETTREQAERAYYVVTEVERAAFFDVERFKGGKGRPDRRHEMFVRAISEPGGTRVRFDTARADFGFIPRSPLSYASVSTIARWFREFPTVQPGHGEAQFGLSTKNDGRFVRYWWEVPSDRIAASQDELGSHRPWARMSKGGDYCRFYFDPPLIVDAEDNFSRIATELCEKYPYLNGNPEWVLHRGNRYFEEGLSWPARTQRGFNIRYLPQGYCFGHKGPTFFPKQAGHIWLYLGVLNATVVEYFLRETTSFGSYELGSIQRIPIPEARGTTAVAVGRIAREIHETKASWDDGNETSMRFRVPGCVRKDVIELQMTIAARLDRLAQYESAEDARIQKLYGELNDEVYKLYGIPDPTRAIIEETMGKRPPELLWPQLEGKTVDQKRMEHVFRLLSYAVKRVVEADEDGIVPFAPVAGEPSLADQVHRELQALFPKLDIGQVEVEIANELKNTVKGYRRTTGIAEWLENAFFEFHCSLYKSRPILWHVASSQGTGPFAFGALVHYHRFDKNRMAQLRAQYLRDAIETFRREAALADKAGRTDARQDWQARLEEAQELDRRLQWVQEGRHEGPEGGDRDYRILTPWKAPEDRPKGWAPDLDDGVKVNIEPIQKAGVLRVAKVVG